ncbi:MAG: hypothetical protein V4772_07870 [Pseudomonadota bacterium]
MTAIAPPLCQRPTHQLLAGQTLHLYLDRASGIQIEQGAIRLVTHEWVAERCVPMTQRLDAGASYEPAASGWVFLQALPGGSVRFCMVSRPAFLAVCFARLLHVSGVLRVFRPILKGRKVFQ